MIEAGDSGVDAGVLVRFLEGLPALETMDLFPERFTLELRTRAGCHLFHVNRGRGVVRPVVPEDSKKKLISLPLSHFIRLVGYGNASHWADALKEGYVRISQAGISPASPPVVLKGRNIGQGFQTGV